MTSSIFKSTQLKATLLGSFRARGGRPDPAKLLKAILMCKEQNKGGIFGEKEYLKKYENKYKKQLSKQAKKEKAINKLNVSSFHWKDEI